MTRLLRIFRKYISRNYHVKMRVSSWWILIKYFPSWLRRKHSHITAIDDQLPWITFEARDYLTTILEPHMRVFEYGIGGSTIFYSNTVAEVIGVEHDKTWIEIVSKAIERRGNKNFSLLFYPPKPILEVIGENIYENPQLYLSADPQFLNKYSFLDYASAIDPYENCYFDIVSIDGRARPSCIRHAIPKIKQGGYLILDNSDREYYVASLSNDLSSFAKVFERYGPGPYDEVFWGTTVYKKLDE